MRARLLQCLFLGGILTPLAEVKIKLAILASSSMETSVAWSKKNPLIFSDRNTCPHRFI